MQFLPLHGETKNLWAKSIASVAGYIRRGTNVLVMAAKRLDRRLPGAINGNDIVHGAPSLSELLMSRDDWPSVEDDRSHPPTDKAGVQGRQQGRTRRAEGSKLPQTSRPSSPRKTKSTTCKQRAVPGSGPRKKK